ncbi:peptidase S41 [Exilibacterium tricleocarpae]|uniref:Peptidase S41 n=1 Tax=Exilibacterium tricleocarpae TaxID=2591008 RepID=A0A545U497_9GAMM|nr:S41 family peptidase [Exilibacterium tricleocarpae]TQV84264.1 peptidase S41 [Exilibacterium tricleocarpae]
MKTIGCTIGLLTLFLLANSSSLASSEKLLSVEERIHGLSLIWKEASYNFAYFDQVPDLDWDATYLEFIPKVINANSNFDYYRLLTRFVSLLSDGMTSVEMPEGLVENHIDFPAVKLAEANRQAVVIAVDQRYKTELPLGSVILKVDGKAVEDKVKQDVFPYISSSTEHIRWHKGIRGSSAFGYGLLAGVPGTWAEIKVKYPHGEEKTLKIRRDARDRTIGWHSVKGLGSDDDFQFQLLDNGMAYLALNSFDNEEVIEKFRNVLHRLKLVRGLIIDLRYNAGGNTYIAEEIVKHLSYYDIPGARTRMRIHNSTFKAWGRYAEDFSWAEKYRPYFEGDAWLVNEPEIVSVDGVDKVVIPTILLIGRETSGAAEDFLVYTDSLKHFTTIGEPTFGSTGQPLLVELPGGGRAYICTKRDMFSDGRDFVGYGIQPDIKVVRDVDYYLSREDAVLERAKALLINEAGRLGQGALDGNAYQALNQSNVNPN